MGGLARRVSFFNAFRDRFKDVPTLYLEGGELFSANGFDPNPMLVDQWKLDPEAIIRNEWVVRGYQQTQPNTIINLAALDLPYASRYLLNKTVYQQKLAEWPLLGNFISANIRPVSDQHVAPSPFLVREIRGTRLRSPRHDGALRVAITGLTQPMDMRNTGYVITDPFAALRRLLPELRQQADMVIVLAALPIEDVLKLAKQFPQLDVVIGNPRTTATSSDRKGAGPLVVMASHQTKSVGELRLYQDQTGKVSEIVNRMTGLDANIVDDPVAAQIVSEAKRQYLQVHQPPTGH